MSLEITDEKTTEVPQTSSTEAPSVTDNGTTEVSTQEETKPSQESTENVESAEKPQEEGEKAESTEETPKETTEFDYSEYEKEFLSTGDISQESREKLYKQFPKNLVDNYIENMKQATAYAIAETEKKAFSVVGGEDNYKQLIEWASKNLDQDEKDLFNETVSGSNEKLALQAIKGLKARMDLANTNRKPNVVLGSTEVVTNTGDVFLSRQDYANAIADPKYQTSPQYRADVDAKLARTIKSGGYKA